MHLESHATPIGESPQQRYASLHRAIERGLASDEVWNELAGVCDALGNRGEALHCLHRIRDDALRTRAERAVLGGEGRGADQEGRDAGVGVGALGGEHGPDPTGIGRDRPSAPGHGRSGSQRAARSANVSP